MSGQVQWGREVMGLRVRGVQQDLASVGNGMRAAGGISVVNGADSVRWYKKVETGEGGYGVLVGRWAQRGRNFWVQQGGVGCGDSWGQAEGGRK